MTIRTRRSLVWVALASLALAVAPALAKQTFEFVKAGLLLDVPDSWKTEIKDDVLKITSKDEGIEIDGWSVDNKEFDKAVDDLIEELQGIIKDAKVVGKPTKLEINGLTAVGVEGTGKVEGENVKWLVLFVKAKNPVMVTAFASPEALDKNEKEVQNLFLSIRPKG